MNIKQIIVVFFFFAFFYAIWLHEVAGLIGLIIGFVAGIAATSETDNR